MCTYLCAPTYVHLPMCTYLCAPTCVHLPVCIYLCAPTYVHLPMCTYRCEPTHVHLPMCTYLCETTNLEIWVQRGEFNFCFKLAKVLTMDLPIWSHQFCHSTNLDLREIKHVSHLHVDVALSPEQVGHPGSSNGRADRLQKQLDDFYVSCLTLRAENILLYLIPYPIPSYPYRFIGVANA